jgi:hypothetical protein
MATRTITLTASDPQEARAIAALRAFYTRNNQVPTAGQAWGFFEAEVRQLLVQRTRDHESSQAQAAAEAGVTPITVT